MLILASGSPRRAKILRDLGIAFTVVKSDAQEVSYPHDPERTVKENALAKGAAVSYPTRLASRALANATRMHRQSRREAVARVLRERCGYGVLSADTIVWYNGRIYGKPKDLAEAKEYLGELSGNVHTVFTGVAYNGEVKVVKSDVKFRRLSEAMIDEYVARVKPTDRAGAYDIDESGDLIVESYTGSYENIMGLPVEPLRDWRIVR